MGLGDKVTGRIRAMQNRREAAALKRQFPDFDAETLRIIEQVRPYTMTGPERISAICQAVRYVEANDIAGDFVECGVWKGGSSMAAALSFKKPRPLHLYDTFEGMSAPTEADVRIKDGADAENLLKAADKSRLIWCVSPLEEVRANVHSTGYPEDKIVCVKGKVEDTIPGQAPERIAILRLDTDWYESTRHELEHLYPRLSPGGVLILDDYGYWQGARKAVDEYFGGRVLLHRVDSESRMLVKA